jgi:ammonia channel protein AmtB
MESTKRLCWQAAGVLDSAGSSVLHLCAGSGSLVAMWSLQSLPLVSASGLSKRAEQTSG